MQCRFECTIKIKTKANNWAFTNRNHLDWEPLTIEQSSIKAISKENENKARMNHLNWHVHIYFTIRSTKINYGLMGVR